ncbi:hypothetical protein [Coraliomargarita sinensis]|uniref:hypothetical protein n=1 Tax=Coraliomargarita sinensis TaxID=2174842 RepID=UPI0011B4419E|nr:hypothetical protein [Coraliomargarita sinensis]
MKNTLSALTIFFASMLSGAELPLSVEALIPRHANVSWHSDIEWGEKVCVLYYLPDVGRNDATKFLEIIELREDGSSEQLSRIYLGGRGASVVDKIEANGRVITIHAREHKNSDPISTPSKEVLITVSYSSIPVLISKTYTKHGSNQTR